MRQKDSIDTRKISDAYSGDAFAAQQDQPRREDGIDQYIVTAKLHKEGGVANECDRGLVLGDRKRQARLALERVSVALSDQPPKLSQLAHPERDTSCASGGPALAAFHVCSFTPLNQMRE
jgi:hypothetical protein